MTTFFFFSAFTLQAFVSIVHVLKKSLSFRRINEVNLVAFVIISIVPRHVVVFVSLLFSFSVPLRYRIVIEVQSRPLTISFLIRCTRIMHEHTRNIVAPYRIT